MRRSLVAALVATLLACNANTAAVSPKTPCTATGLPTALANLIPDGAVGPLGSRYQIPFATAAPTQKLFVAPGGNDVTADGTADKPFGSVNAALAQADAGTAVMLKAGSYVENVMLSHGGVPGAPLWIVSADGPGMAKLAAKDPTTSTLQGYGVHDIVLQGLDVTSPNPYENDSDGIKFAASGDVSRAENLCRDLAVVDCTVHTAPHGGYNGIKISGSDNVFVIHDVLDGAGQDHDASGVGVDFVGNTNSEIGWTFATNIPVHAGFQVKGGSTTVLFHDNLVRNVGGDGLWIGGGTVPVYMRPSSAYEACNITVRDVVMHDLGNSALHFVGGQGSATTHLFSWKTVNAYVQAEASSDQHAAIACANDSVLESRFDGSGTLLAGDEKSAIAVSADSDLAVTAVTSSAGNATFDGGTLITASGGHNVYRLTAGAGPTVIQGFSPSSDVVALTGYVQNGFGALLAVAHQVGPAVFFDLSDGQLLVLEDVTLESLSTSNFSF